MKHFVVFFCMILFTSGLAWGARGPAKVSVTPHNLSGTGPSISTYNTDEDQICVFCHTPHGGSLDAPLWNRSNPTSTTWKQYNSAKLSPIIKGLGASRTPNVESLLCLSCHDGSISVNHVINEPNDRTTPIKSESSGVFDTTIVDFFGVPGSRIGSEYGNLSANQTGFLNDDHPISFSYSAVVTDYQGTSKEGTLRSVVDAENLGVRFFSATDNLECTSCHDPHVNYIDNSEYTPFLVTPNTGSLLCLACHVK